VCKILIKKKENGIRIDYAQFLSENNTVQTTNYDFKKYNCNTTMNFNKK